MNTKKILNIVALVLVVIGLFLKTNHFMGANIAIILSALTMLVTLFMFAVKDNKEAGLSDWLNYFLVGTLSLWIIGAIFKFQHWEGSAIFLFVGYALAPLVPIALIFQTSDFKISKQFFITFFIFFILLLGVVPRNPYLHNTFDTEQSATMDNDSTKTEINMDK